MLSMVRFLMTRPTCEQICQQLALTILSGHRPRKVLLCLFGVDGSLHVVGEFGLSGSEADALGPVSLWDAQPLADSVRTGEPVLVVDPIEAAEHYPQVAGESGAFRPLAVWPLSLPNQRVGAIQMVFDDEPDSAALHADMAGVSAVLALYLSLLTSIASFPDQAVTALRAVDAGGGFPTMELAALQSRPARKPGPSVLTDRQSGILTLMAKGLTNAQIAKRIGFSESTVRQETMVIYRFFGVGGRQEAVRQAGLRGLLPGTSP
jgi:DNA-binding CsgD family transcriptional regulator